MRSTFPEYFDKPRPEYFIKNSIIVLDANILLNLYRLGVTAREDTLGVLEHPSVMDRLWMPYQTGIEFLRNRVGVILELPRAYEKANKALASVRKTILADFGDGRRFETSRNAVENALNELATVEAAISSAQAGDEAILDPEADPVLARIERIFDGRTGSPPSGDTFRARVDHFFDFRLVHKIPPGYEDASKDGVRRAGDYLIWCEILDRAAVEADKPFLLVTDDRKGDWYSHDSGKRLGPRRELTAEFALRSSSGYHQVTFERFLDLVREHLDLSIDEQTIEEIEEVEQAGAAELELWRSPENTFIKNLTYLYDSQAYGKALRENLAKILATHEEGVRRQREIVAATMSNPALNEQIRKSFEFLARSQGEALRKAAGAERDSDEE